ncbi:hypothetical protein [Microbacterium marinilacus]|uniref:Lipoprotein n=1 Tax=Microbacterium marinilacus TaxID=415209 RepID=A0ABP7B9V1_9MICO|nr:hypothetical protein [Microbacterium marinilacus]MBY0687061.1 hypothetical protein [Microbacterium marinilacus]
MHTLRLRALAGAALTAAVLAVATGCAAIEDALHKERSLSFETLHDLAEGWDREVSWFPADATGIRIAESSIAADASVLLASSQELDPDLCAPSDRLSAPSYQVDGAPDVYAASDAYACGAWTVIAAPGGWYGWTPNHSDERAASPTE